MNILKKDPVLGNRLGALLPVKRSVAAGRWLLGALIFSGPSVAVAEDVSAVAAPASAAASTPVTVTPAVEVTPAAAAPQPTANSAAALEPAPAAPIVTEPAPGQAEDVAEAEDAVPAEDAAQAEARKKKKKKKDKGGDISESFSFGDFKVKGRVLGVGEWSRQRPQANASMRSALDLEVQSARVGLEYQSPIRALSAEVTVDFAPKPKLKDAYAQARSKHFSVRVGQFKAPTSIFELESTWTLPTVHRGLVHDLLEDWLDVGGRRPGLQVGYRGGGSLRPRVSLGAFQASEVTNAAWDVEGDRELELVNRSSTKAQSFAARAQVNAGPVQIGAWSELRAASTTIKRLKYYAVGGVDVALDELLGGGGLRFWVDGVVGSSWYEIAQKRDDGKPAVFAVGRALVGYRIGGVEKGDAYVEPFGFFAGFDPDLSTARDLLWEGALGIAAGYFERARVALQAETRDAAPLFPNSTGGYLAYTPLERWSLLLQAGVAF